MAQPNCSLDDIDLAALKVSEIVPQSVTRPVQWQQQRRFSLVVYARDEITRQSSFCGATIGVVGIFSLRSKERKMMNLRKQKKNLL